MADNTYFNATIRKANTGEEVSLLPPPSVDNALGTRPSACWAPLISHSDYSPFRHDDELLSIEWWMPIQPSCIETVEGAYAALKHHFPQDDVYKVDIKFHDEPVLMGGKKFCKVVFSNFSEYPRGLFMAKLFNIRNMARDPERQWKRLLKLGVPYRIAVVLGTCLSYYKPLGREQETRFMEYANILWLDHADNTATVADLRNFINGKYLGDVGEPWGTGGGYDGVCRSLVKQGYTNSPKLDKFFSHYDNITEEQILSLVKKLKK